eukprot:9130667-Alexandrium_andersonii.AAC.1
MPETISNSFKQGSNCLTSFRTSADIHLRPLDVRRSRSRHTGEHSERTQLGLCPTLTALRPNSHSVALKRCTALFGTFKRRSRLLSNPNIVWEEAVWRTVERREGAYPTFEAALGIKRSLLTRK